VEVPGGGKAWINQLKSLQGTRGWLVMNGVYAKITHHREEWFEDRWSEYDNEVAPLEWEYIPTLVKATARRLQECKD
jgi:hypothetical protein